MNDLSKQEWKTRHVRVEDEQEGNKWQRGGITLRYREEIDLRRDATIEYSYAICNPKDEYCRKTGILVADENTTISLTVEDACSSFRIEKAILEDIVYLTRESLSKETLNLIYTFVRVGTIRELDKFFYPKS